MTEKKQALSDEELDKVAGGDGYYNNRDWQDWGRFHMGQHIGKYEVEQYLNTKVIISDDTAEGWWICKIIASYEKSNGCGGTIRTHLVDIGGNTMEMNGNKVTVYLYVD